MIEPGLYKHFKGGRYRVLLTASHSETKEDMVVYVSLSYGTIWARPAAMFNETVQYPDGTSGPRFVRE
jgi:hypothetical protein